MLIGGQGGDTLTTGDGNDLVIGDSGDITYDALGAIQVAKTTGHADGGDDVIVANAGNNTVLGGFGTDTITTLGGVDIIVGDNGSVNYTASVLIQTTDADESTGGADIVKAGDGKNVVLGGAGGDFIDTGSNDDVVLGDHGEVEYIGVFLQHVAS